MKGEPAVYDTSYVTGACAKRETDIDYVTGVVCVCFDFFFTFFLKLFFKFN